MSGLGYYSMIHELALISGIPQKYPPVAILNCKCTKTYKIPETNVVLEEGILTAIPVLGLQYDPKYYPDPGRFNLERFSEE
jgi:cytochrome P450 family 6